MTRTHRVPAPVAPPPAMSRDAATRLVGKVRVTEDRANHEYRPDGTVSSYQFYAYRADGQRACAVIVNAAEADHVASAGQPEREKARDIARRAGTRRLIDDAMGLPDVEHAPEDVQYVNNRATGCQI